MMIGACQKFGGQAEEEDAERLETDPDLDEELLKDSEGPPEETKRHSMKKDNPL